MTKEKKYYHFISRGESRLEFLLNLDLSYNRSPVDNWLWGFKNPLLRDKESRRVEERKIFETFYAQAKESSETESAKKEISLYGVNKTFFHLVKAYSLVKEKIGLDKLVVSVDLRENFLDLVVVGLGSGWINAPNRGFFNDHFPEFKKFKVRDVTPNKILGVSLYPSERDVKDAYHNLAYGVHPDTSKNGNSESIKNFTRLNKAYNILMEPFVKKNNRFEKFKKVKIFIKNYLSSRRH